tara:strand:+ start:793 stop:957 length:165 start_codon:yes stop_codon:yes gene_type:complete
MNFAPIKPKLFPFWRILEAQQWRRSRQLKLSSPIFFKIIYQELSELSGKTYFFN